MVYKSLDELIGSTPLMELTNIGSGIYAKLEFFNPAGSIKDRAAKYMIEDFEKKGMLKKGSVIIEPTSGNTGIGLASVAAAKGYKVIIVMPDTMSKERRVLMSAYGASVVLTDGKKGMAGAIEEADRLNKEIEGSIVLGQFVNPANPKAHYETTAKEIYEDLNGDVDIFVCAVGTGGTISGAGRYLKEKNPLIRVVGVEPQSSAVLSGKKPGPHKIQGIGAGFVTEITDTSVIDEIVTVTDEKAYEYARLIAKKEGLLVGISSGAALCAAVKVSEREENRGKKIAVIMPDGGSRYLSTDLYEEK